MEVEVQDQELSDSSTVKKKSQKKTAAGRTKRPAVVVSKKKKREPEVDLWVPEKIPERQYRGSGVAVQKGDAREVVVFGKVQRVVAIDPTKSSRHAQMDAFYRECKDTGVPVDQFKCNDPACVGVLVGGQVHHSWNCSWWKRPENKNKTPF